MSPLISWDIAQEGMQRRIALQKDLAKLDMFASSNKWNTKAQWRNGLIWEDKTIILTDPVLKIVYASENIFSMNGYSQQEVIGKTPRIFQGEKTARNELAEIRRSVKKQIAFESFIINYKKNGEIYNCHIEGYPVFNKQKELLHFIALENVA